MLLRQDCNCPRQADFIILFWIIFKTWLPTPKSFHWLGGLKLAGRGGGGGGGGGGGAGGGGTELYFPIVPAFHSRDSMVDLGAMVSHVLYQGL